MKIGMVSSSTVPYHTGGGVAMVNWAFLNTFLRRGHRVVVYSILFDDAGFPKDMALKADSLMKSGAELVLIRLGAQARQWENRFATAAAEDTLAARVRDDGVEALFVYTCAGLEAAAKVALPKACALVDLDHQVAFYRRQSHLYGEPVAWEEMETLHAIGYRVMKRTLELLADCDLVVEHAAHHSEWLRRQGIACDYFATPVEDPFPGGWQPAVGGSGNPKPVFLMAGHVMGVATLSGLWYAVEHVFPRLDELLGPEGYVVRIVGADEVYPQLKRRLLGHPSVALAGYVGDMAIELAGADVVLVTTPIPLGCRTRIVEAFAHGKAVVSHMANRFGIQELQNGVNCLLANNGPGLAEAAVQAAQDAGLRATLANGGRETFVRHMHPQITCARVSERLEALVQAGMKVGVRLG